MVAFSACALACVLTASSDTVLLQFTADWCGACRTVEPTVRRLASERFPVQQVNVDRQRDLAGKYRVTAVPCFVLVVGGHEVERVEGAASYARLVQMFDRAAAVTAIGGVTDPAPAQAQAQSLVRGQSAAKSGGFSLPRPLASLAKGLRGGARDTSSGSDPQVPGVVVTVDPPATQDSGPPAEPAWARPNPPHANPPSSGPATGWTQPGRSTPELESSRDASLVMQSALRASVRLRIEDDRGNSVGSGTIVDSHGSEALIVTCGHLFRDSQGRGSITVDLFADNPPRQLSGTLISYDLDRDIALVAITPGTPVTVAPVAPPGIVVQRGSGVFSIGCDRGAAPSVRESSVTGIDRYVGSPNFEVAGMPVDGRSGGGLFTQDGMLIGVCNAADPQDREGIFAALPIIHWELDKIGQRRIYENSSLARASNAIPPDPRAASEDFHAVRQESENRMASASSASSPRTEPPFAEGSTPADDEMEVICIVRSRRNPQAKEQLLVVDRPSRDFLDRLTLESKGARLAAMTGVPGNGEAMLHQPSNPPRPTSNANPILRAQSNDR